MDRPKENLRTEQKATIEMMYAEGKDEAAIAKAIDKQIATVRRYIDSHIFELRDKSGRMPDGTPKAGREPVMREPEQLPEPVQEDAPESMWEPEMPEVQPYREWVNDRIGVLQGAIIERARTMQELPEEWVSEYNNHIAALVEEQKA